MNRIIGTVSIAGSLCAFSSAFISRSFRISADSTRRDWARGVPYFSVWPSVLTRARMPGMIRTGVEVLKRLGAFRHESELDRGQGHLVGEFRRRFAEFLGQSLHAGVETQPRLGADHHQVEPVGQCLGQQFLALGAGILHEDVG